MIVLTEKHAGAVGGFGARKLVGAAQKTNSAGQQINSKGQFISKQAKNRRNLVRQSSSSATALTVGGQRNCY